MIVIMLKIISDLTVKSPRITTVLYQMVFCGVYPITTCSSYVPIKSSVNSEYENAPFASKHP